MGGPYSRVDLISFGPYNRVLLYSYSNSNYKGQNHDKYNQNNRSNYNQNRNNSKYNSSRRDTITSRQDHVLIPESKSNKSAFNNTDYYKRQKNKGPDPYGRPRQRNLQWSDKSKIEEIDIKFFVEAYRSKSDYM